MGGITPTPSLSSQHNVFVIFHQYIHCVNTYMLRKHVSRGSTANNFLEEGRPQSLPKGRFCLTTSAIGNRIPQLFIHLISGGNPGCCSFFMNTRFSISSKTNGHFSLGQLPQIGVELAVS
jgi:hypothetical protein